MLAEQGYTLPTKIQKTLLKWAGARTEVHMAKKRDSEQKERKVQGEKAVSRRDFVKKGAAGVSAAVLSTSGTALAQVSPVQAIQWTYEADIVIIGGGCTGLPAAIRARDLGASVIIVDQNFDPGGKMLHSGGQVSFGRSEERRVGKEE